MRFCSLTLKQIWKILKDQGVNDQVACIFCWLVRAAVYLRDATWFLHLPEGNAIIPSHGKRWKGKLEPKVIFLKTSSAGIKSSKNFRLFVIHGWHSLILWFQLIIMLLAQSETWQVLEKFKRVSKFTNWTLCSDFCVCVSTGYIWKYKWETYSFTLWFWKQLVRYLSTSGETVPYVGWEC